MNKRAILLLKEWDPFLLGEDAYHQEIADVVARWDEIDYPSDLAKCIREVYEHFHDSWIPLENCM